MNVRQEQAERLYPLLVREAARLHLRRLTYRCRSRRCELLDAIETPGGIVLHQKRYKYSDELNLALSSEAGRVANTYDGANHWRPHTYFIDTSALALTDEDRATLSLQCDHTRVSLTPSEFAADWDALDAPVILLPR